MSIRAYRRFRDVLGFLNNGRYEEKIDDHLVHAIETLQALPNGRSGKAIITLTFEITHDNDRLDFKPTVKSKLPEDKAFSGTPFWAFEGGVSTQHPKQLDMLNGRPQAVPNAVPNAVPMPNEPREFG